MSETLATLKNRRSCRAYKPEHVEKEKLDAILEAGTYAATGMGKQSPIILVIRDPEVRNCLMKLNAAAMGVDMAPFYGAPELLVVLANKDTKNKDIVKKIIEWITLDSSETGLQYYWANGTLNGEGGTKDSVASGTVMSKSDGKLDFLNDQNMFEAFVPANQYANGKNLTQYDETINTYWRDQVRQYTAGAKTREQAIADFKTQVKENLDVVVE